MKKYMFALAIFILRIIYVDGQNYKIPVENSKDGKLTLEDFTGNTTIVGYDGKEVLVSATGDNDEESSSTVPERAKGLKPIYSRGVDNTGVGLKMEKNGNQITLTCLMPFTKRRDYKIKVPNNFSVKADSKCGMAEDIIVEGMNNEIEIKTCQNIRIKSVTGSLILSTISGNIDIDQCGTFKDQTLSVVTISGEINVKFTDFNLTNAATISSVSGEVDITMPAKSAFNLKMNTISGTLYSDFEVSDPSKKMKPIGRSHIDYAINGGGTEFNLSTISGNVYLRKSK